MSSKKIIFSCQEGHRNEIYPPDPQHTTMSLEKPKEAEGTIYERIVDCVECHIPITLYWYRPKMHISVA